MKKCHACLHDNPVTAKFCSNCGANLQGLCSNCGANNPVGAKFCMECGFKLNSTPAPFSPVTSLVKKERKAERRQLTVMFCDLVGSTPLSQRMDAEDYRELILEYIRIAESVIERHGGHVARYMGDGLLVYFGYPEGLEDAPKAGVRAGLGILEAMSHANKQWEAANKTTLHVRIGIHTGLTVVDDLMALGETPNIAARLEGLAPTDGLVISPQTFRLVKGWFEVQSTGNHKLKGIADPMEIFLVLRESGAKTRIDIAKGQGLSPLVGRQQEYQILRERWSRAKEGKGNLVLLNGEAGIGKSRLVDTLKEEIASEPNSWLTELRCSPYHQNSAFYPIIDLLENTVLEFRRDDSPENRLAKLEGFLLQSGMELESSIRLFADFLSISTEQYPPPNLSPVAKKQRLMESLTQALLHRATLQPVLFVLEDLHWADASTLEWLNLFLAQLTAQNIFTLCTTRPGFQADWISRTEVTQITLHRLDANDVQQICDHFAKGKTLPQHILEQVFIKTEGVPLFVEELTKMVLESDLLEEQDERFELVGPVPDMAIPSTLQDSLLARLDRLSAVKEIVQLGAVLGREFSYEILKSILTRDEHELQLALTQLVGAGILFRTGLGQNISYKFKHALIQDAAYESMLKSQRRQLHSRVAQTLQTQFEDIILSQPELAATHYTKAALHLKAIPLWLKAGQLASQKHANQEAISHLEAGLALLDQIDDESTRKDYQLDFLLTLGGASIVYYGYAHEKVGIVFNQAKDAAQTVEVSPKLAFILYNLQTYYMIAGQFDTSTALVDYELQLAESTVDNYFFSLIGFASRGVSSVFEGNYFIANDYLKRATHTYDPKIPIPLELTPGGDIKINAASWLSVSLQISGYAEQARQISKDHLGAVASYPDSRTLYHIYSWVGWRLLVEKQWMEVVSVMEEYLPIAKEFGDPFFNLIAGSYHQVALGYQGDRAALDQADQNISALIGAGANSIYAHAVYLGELYYKFGEYEKAIEWIERTTDYVEKIGSKMYYPELLRIRGLISQTTGNHGFQKAEDDLLKSLKAAKIQGAKLFELRSAMNLGDLWKRQGRIEEATTIIREVYNWFTEGFDSPDLVEARAFLEELETNPIDRT